LPQCIANKEFNALAGATVYFQHFRRGRWAFFLVVDNSYHEPKELLAVKQLITNRFFILETWLSACCSKWAVCLMYHAYARDIRLLLVEDNPGDVWLMREALRLAQVPVDLTVARDGLEASRYLHQVESNGSAGPDLVLLDLNLPRRNGREVLADIRRSQVLQAVPVVIVSSSDAEEDRRQAFHLRANGFMTKPSSLPAYVEMVRGMGTYLAEELVLRKTA